MTNLNFNENISRNIVIRQIKTRIRLFLAIILGLFVWLLLLRWWSVHHNTTKFIISWISWAILYLCLAFAIIFRSTHEDMKSRAQLEDEWQFVILFLVIIAAIVSLVSIVAELSVVKDLHWITKYEHLVLAILTILISWFFTHTMFALHYAHDYYARVVQWKSWWLEFPWTNEPVYTDFLYFAYVIWTSGQTADVSFTSKRLRRIWTIHCVLAFLFNTTVLALMINIASGLF